MKMVKTIQSSFLGIVKHKMEKTSLFHISLIFYFFVFFAFFRSYSRIG